MKNGVFHICTPYVRLKRILQIIADLEPEFSKINASSISRFYILVALSTAEKQVTYPSFFECGETGMMSIDTGSFSRCRSTTLQNLPEHHMISVQGSPFTARITWLSGMSLTEVYYHLSTVDRFNNTRIEQAIL